MSRAKKSTRLLQKLNRSLERETSEPAEPAASVSVPEASAAKTERPAAPIVTDLEIVSPTPPKPPLVDQISAPSTVITPPTPIAGAIRPADRRPRAEEIVRSYLPFAAGAGLIPLPGVDLAAIGALQLKVLAALARHYDVAFTRAQAEMIVTSLLGSVGGTVLASSALGSFAKFLPGIGTLLSLTTLPIASSVVTLAIGRLAIDHFEAGGTMIDFDLDVAQSALERKLAEAKRALA